MSHGARTLSYEAAAAGLGRLLGGAAELQVGVARFYAVRCILITSRVDRTCAPIPA